MVLRSLMQPATIDNCNVTILLGELVISSWGKHAPGMTVVAQLGSVDVKWCHRSEGFWPIYSSFFQIIPLQSIKHFQEVIPLPVCMLTGVKMPLQKNWHQHCRSIFLNSYGSVTKLFIHFSMVCLRHQVLVVILSFHKLQSQRATGETNRRSIKNAVVVKTNSQRQKGRQQTASRTTH